MPMLKRRVARLAWNTRSSDLWVNQVARPSSSQGSSTSLFATMPWKTWWESSCSVMPSGALRSRKGSKAREDAVTRVGYSMPSAPAASFGVSTTVSTG